MLGSLFGGKKGANDAYSSAFISQYDDDTDVYQAVRAIESTITRIPKAFLEIKTPQLIGIILGALTFLVTIVVVLVLLYQSGSLERLKNELEDVGPGVKSRGKKNKKDTDPMADHMAVDDLYDELIDASKNLPSKPEPSLMLGHKVYLKTYKSSDKFACLAACDGTAIYGGCAYNPVRLFGWFNYPDHLSVDELFTALYESSNNNQCTHLVIVDQKTRQYIGMLSLLDNQPANLSIRIGQMWLTPSYQNKKYVAHESMYLVLNWLFGEKYRRVSVETDSRNLIYRKFLERCGFKCEAILRKHRIFKGCKNRDTAMYVILNSEWYKESIRSNLRTVCGLPDKPKGRKLISIDGGIGIEKLRFNNEGFIQDGGGKSSGNPDGDGSGYHTFEGDISAEKAASGRHANKSKYKNNRNKDDEDRTMIVGEVSVIEKSPFTGMCMFIKKHSHGFPVLIQEDQQDLRLVAASIYMSRHMFTSEVYKIGLYLSEAAFSRTTEFFETNYDHIVQSGNSGNNRSNSNSSLTDELIPPPNVPVVMSEYDLMSMAKVCSNGNLSPVYIIITIKLCKTIDCNDVFRSLFGSKASEIFKSCASTTLNKFTKEIHSFIPRGQTGFNVGEELSFLLLESKDLFLLKDGRKTNLISDATFTNKLLSLYLDPRHSIVGNELFANLSSAMSYDPDCLQ